VRSPQANALCEILTVHVPDQRPNLGINPRTAAEVAGLPAPVGAKTASVPTDHGLRLNNDDRVQQRRVQSIKPYEQQAFEVSHSHPPRGLAPWHNQLLAQDEILGLKPRSPREPRPYSKQQLDQKLDHRTLL
jgi:hypothetical protein